MSYVKWTPAKVETVRAMMAEGKSGPEIAEAVGRNLSSVHALFRRFGDHKDRTRPSSEIPTDLREKWEVMSTRALAAHYGRSVGTVSAWCHRSGLVRDQSWRSPSFRSKPKPEAVPTPITAEKPAPFRRGTQRKPDYRNAPTITVRDLSVVGQAAEYLRRFGSVYRCDERGVATPTGTFWRRGSAILSDAELIERAEYNRRREAERRAA